MEWHPSSSINDPPAAATECKLNVEAVADDSSGFPKVGLFGGNPANNSGKRKRRLGCAVMIFFTQLILVYTISAVLIVQGFFSFYQNHYFVPAKWLIPPLLAAIGAAGSSASAFLLLSHLCPIWILPASFYLNPILFCGLIVMMFLECTNSGTCLLLGIAALCFAIAHVCYVRRVHSRFPFGIKAIQKSCQIVPIQIPHLVAFTILGATLSSTLLLCGIGGATTLKNNTKLNTTFIIMILLTLPWTLQVAKIMIHVLAARSICLNKMELRETLIHAMDDIVCGSLLIPLSELVQASVRALNLIFSCGSCTDHFSTLAMVLSRNTNRWGLVHVGVYKKSFIQSAADTWDRFHASEMGPLIDTDLTELVCSFCGFSGGATSALVAGLYRVIFTEDHRSYTIQVSIYAFLIGYLMSRIAVTWVQARVDAFYVAYANDASSGRPYANSIIAARLEELKLEQPLLLN